MHEHFDDSIRRQMDGLESPVPKDMFDAIRQQPDVQDAAFDAVLRNKLQSAETPVPAGLFSRISVDADLADTPFDGFVQQQLTAYPSLVPADMWSRIRRKKDRRRPAAWWWVAAGVVLLLSGGTWYTVQHSNNNKAVAGNKQSVEKYNGKNDHNLQRTNGTFKQNSNVPIASDTLQGVIPNAQNSTSSQQDNFTKTPVQDNQNTVSNDVRKKNVADGSDGKTSVTAFSKNTGDKKSTVYQANSFNKKRISSEDEPAIILNNSRDEGDAADATATLSKISLAIGQQLRNAAKLSPGQLLKAKPRLPVIPCPTDGYSRRNDWYIDIYSSAFLVRKNITDTQANKNAKTGFDSTLHRQVSYNAGISLVKNIGKSMLLKTGVQYNQVNESFRLTRINERKLVTVISVRTVIIAPGDTVLIRDTSVTEHIGTVQRHNQNKYQQWDVPVIIGYEFGGEGVRLNANAGIIANIRSAYSGEMIADTTQQIVDVKDYHGKPLYKTNVGISLYAGLSIIKPLGEKTSLLIEPYARIGIKNIAAEQAWFKQKNCAAGISVGLRYQLNGGRQRR